MIRSEYATQRLREIAREQGVEVWQLNGQLAVARRYVAPQSSMGAHSRMGDLACVARAVQCGSARRLA